jgi:hypothetical protein
MIEVIKSLYPIFFVFAALVVLVISPSDEVRSQAYQNIASALIGGAAGVAIGNKEEV